MGKKSRKPIRNKLKDTAAASSTTAVAATVLALEWDQLVNQMSIFNQMFTSKDWEGIFQTESTVTRAAKMLENDHPLIAGSCYYYLATAHKELGREGGIEQAIVCFQKALEMAKKASDERLHHGAVLDLTTCFIETGRIQEAMDLYKSLVSDIEKERLDPNCILALTATLKRHKEYGRALEVLEDHLDVIESTWDKPRQCAAYGMIACNYLGMYDYNKSIVHYERQLSIAEDIKDAALEAEALYGLGYNHGRVCDCDKAMEWLEQGLVPLSDTGDIVGQGRIYYVMGVVLLAQDGREQEAIEMLQKANGILETCDDPEGMSFILCKLGEAYTRIVAWDDAIKALEKGISIAVSIEFQFKSNELQSQANQLLGQTYLEQYYSDESLVGVPATREEVIRKASLCSQEAINLRREDDPTKPIVYLDLVQELYFLGDTENAQAVLTEYLDRTVKLGPSHCQTCHQSCAKDETMMVCVGCHVARYCSQDHQRRAWKKGRLCHKVMCPLLKRWRRLQKGRYTTDSRNAIFNDFFVVMLRSDVVNADEQHDSENEE
jgi:tetratricopeptide (TPR) repeat protein